MNESLSIILVEDDPLECQNIIKYADSLDDVRLLHITNNAAKALECVKDSLPDAIILDLELHKGGGDGLTFLSQLNKFKLPIKPYVLVTTNNISHVTHESARNLGADFIMVKNQEDYNEKTVIDFLRALTKMIHSNRKTMEQTDACSVEPLQLGNQRMINRIAAEFDRMGFSPKVVGRKYLIDSIMLVINSPNRESVYAPIAEKYEKSDSSVERAMQNAINKVWRTADIDVLLKHYTARINSAKGVPTVTEFIYYFAEKIKNEY